MARYSRSAQSIEEIWGAVGNGEAEERLAKIFLGYGHASVAGMAHQAVAIEGVSILDSLRFFYTNLYGDGQERSTRYQDAFTPYVGVMPVAYQRAYVELVMGLLARYHRSLGVVESVLERVYPPESQAERRTLRLRVLDCCRYLLPLGVQTSLGMVQSARAWRDYLQQLAVWGDGPSLTLRQALQDELDKSGIRLLVRHADDVREPSHWEVPPATPAGQDVEADEPGHLQAVVEQLAGLQCVEGHPRWDGQVPAWLGAYLSQQEHYGHARLVNVGAIRVRGYADLGTVKDLNRHRSLERFVPFLERGYDLGRDLERPAPYERPPYPAVAELFDLDDYYRQVRDFWWAHQPTPDHRYFTRCLLPQAHRVAYCYYGSPADWNYVIRLRIRPGGHQRYRQEAARWGQALARLSPLFCTLPTDATETRASFYSRG